MGRNGTAVVGLHETHSEEGVEDGATWPALGLGSDEPSQPTRLDPGDRDYHAYITRQTSRLEALQQEIAAIQGARRAWGGYLGEKYGLPDGTTVNPDGVFSYPEMTA